MSPKPEQGGAENNARRQLLIQLRRWLFGSAAVVIIAAGIVVGMGRALTPLADNLRPWLEQRLADSLGQPASIGQVEASWPRLTPEITLHQVRAGPEAAPLIALDQARLELDLAALFRRGAGMFRLVVLGLDMTLSEDADGGWGLSFARGDRLSAAGGGGGTMALDLYMRDARIRIRPQNLPAAELLVGEGFFRRRNEQTVVMAHASLAGDVHGHFSIALTGHEQGGKLHSATGEIDIQQLQLNELGLERVLPDFVQLAPDFLDLNIGFDWQSGGSTAVDAGFVLADHAGFELGGSLRAERSERRTDIKLIGLECNHETVIDGLVLAHSGQRTAVEAPDIDLAALHALGSRWLSRWDQWPQAAAGRVSQLEVLYEHPGSLHRFSGTVTGFEIDMPGDRLGLSGLDARLKLEGDRAAAEVSGSPVLDWPMKMRRPIDVDSISGMVVAAPGAVELVDVRASRPEAEAHASGWIWLGGGRPFLDFIIIADRAGPVDPRPWLPAGQIPPAALGWLDDALLEVGSARGWLNYHVRLGHPFRKWHSGAFQTHAEFDDATLAFWPGWPSGSRLEGQVDFVGRALHGRIDSGYLGPLAIRSEQVDINDLSEPVIDINLGVPDADADQLRAVVAGLPLDVLETYAQPAAALGRADLRLDLKLPVRNMRDWWLAGQLDFSGTTLELPAAGMVLPDLNGRLDFDREKIFPARLDMAGTNESISLEADLTAPAQLRASGHVSVARLLSDESWAGEPAKDIHGASWWYAQLDGSNGSGWRLKLQSDLVGTTLDLPAPLNKPAWQPRELRASLGVNDDALQLEAALGSLLNVVADSGAGRLALAAGLEGPAPSLPVGGGFNITGHLEHLSIQPWSRRFSNLFPDLSGDDSSGWLNLDIDRIDHGRWQLERVAVRGLRKAASWQMHLSGPSMEGHMVVPLPVDSGRVLSADLKHVALKGPAVDDALSADPIVAGRPSLVESRVPTELPPLHVLIESLRLNGFDLGRLRLESHARSQGMEFELLEVEGPSLKLSGHGRWIVRQARPVTEFEGRLSTEKLSDLMAVLGLETRLDSALSEVSLRGSWPGAPSDFALARLDGQLELAMHNGRILDAQPGAGRLIGLISLSAVPRRLMLDFRDVFGQGLSFDRIEGVFDLKKGVATTAGLVLKSPSANITVTGQTDLGAQTYNQIIRVEPSVGATLPVIGGLAGGPAGAAAGLLLQGVLNRPLQNVAEARYRVTGDWQAPVVQLVDARPAVPDYSRREDASDSGQKESKEQNSGTDNDDRTD